jgi:hypothetical protein
MILDHLGKNLLFLRLGLELCSFGFATGCLISLQFKHNTLSSSLAKSGSEMYFPQDEAEPPRPISSKEESSETGLNPKALSSLNPQPEQVLPPKISNNFSLIVA